MSDQRKQEQGTQHEDWGKKPENQGGQGSGQNIGQQQGQPKGPQSERDKMDKDQQKKQA